MTRVIRATVLGSLLTAALSHTFAAEAELDELRLVARYADALIENGRDVYGEKHSPLFAACLDRKTLRQFPAAEFQRLWRIRLDDWDNWMVRNSERCFQGANPHQDQNLYQILYALSEIKQSPRYAREADAALTWFFKHTQSPTTGLYPWGEHMAWDLIRDDIINEGRTHDTTHEFRRAWELWERSFELAPKACRRFALGLWHHQIGDQRSGNFSRHAGYLRHKPELDSEYPRHGGFYIATWAEAYRRTQEKVFLQAIEVLVSGFDRRRSSASGAIPAESNQRSGGKMLWATSNLALAIDVWNSAAKVPSDLAEKLRAFTRKTDEVFVNLPHRLDGDGAGFFLNGHLDTLEPYGEGTWAGYSGFEGEAGTAILCLIRFRQTDDPRYRELALKSARRFLEREPAWQKVIHPSTIGSYIWLLLGAHELTQDEKYLRRADTLAAKGVELFLGDDLPIPRATVKYSHYEAVTGADDLMMALLKLWLRKNQPQREPSLRLEWPNR